MSWLVSLLLGWLADLWFVPAGAAAALWIYSLAAPGRLEARLVSVVSIALAALAGWLWIVSALAEARADGVSAERAVWADRVDREERRQDGANATAIAAARAEIIHLRTQSDALAALLEDLTHEADVSPDRDHIALPADSVRRLAAVGRAGRCEALRPAARTAGSGGRSGGSACRAMTVSEVEDGWRRDRATIVEAQRREAARARFYEARDGVLRGDQSTAASPGFSPVK